jgi:very-short-patch-repair endonuclease
MLAAVLACGEGSVVSHGTAAFLLGLWRFQPDKVDVIAPCESGRAVAGVKRRFAAFPAVDERTVRDGVPVTTPARTIVDLAGVMRQRSLSRTVEQAAVAGALDVGEIERILVRGRRRGAPALRAILEDWRGHRPQTRVRSVLEAKLLRLLGHSKLPAPEVNKRVLVGASSYEVDFIWQSRRLVVETDGERFHSGPASMRRDARRDADLGQAGYRVLRFGWDDVDGRPERTIAEIDRALHIPLLVKDE